MPGPRAIDAIRAVVGQVGDARAVGRPRRIRPAAVVDFGFQILVVQPVGLDRMDLVAVLSVTNESDLLSVR